MNLSTFLKRRLGLIVLCAVLGYCVVYALAFIRLYRLEHPYKLASQWIFANVPAGSRISSPHWDDKVPVGIPTGDTAIYQMNGRDFELPVYERDTPQMIESIVRRIASSDYLTFATPRAPDSIPRIPDEYPNMSALLRLLWGEKIGFTFVHSTKNRPSFLGITFNDDLADESFSVYDHPKVVIFKNQERLSVEQILERIKKVERYEPLPSMNEMLLMDSGGWVPSTSTWQPVWSHSAQALAVAVVLGLCAWCVVGRICAWLPDAGLGLSALVGVVTAAAAAWGLSVSKVVPLTRAGGGFVVLGAFVLAAVTCILRVSLRQRLAAAVRTHGIATIVSICVGAVIVSVMRSSDASLLGLGERVDAAYLAYLVRNEDPVPWDLFHPGQKLALAFADRFALAWLLKTVGVPAEFAVSVSYMVLGGLLAGALYSVLVGVLRRVKPALVGVLIAIIPAIYLLHVARDVVNRPLAAVLGSPQTAPHEDLVRWVKREVVATPRIVEACDQPASVATIAPVVGLPSFVEVVTAEAASPLCSLDDPQQVYQRMMAHTLELFVMPSGAAASTPAARARYERFSSRPDLFALVFDDKRVAVFVPSFSRYYPRSVVS